MSATFPGRTLLTQAIVLEIRKIRPENGFRTNIGQTVIVGRPRLNDLEAPISVVQPGSAAIDENSYSDLDNEFSIHGFLSTTDGIVSRQAIGPGTGYVAIDAMIEDIRKAMDSLSCQSDICLGVEMIRAEPNFPEAGGKHLSASVIYQILTPREEEEY